MDAGSLHLCAGFDVVLALFLPAPFLRGLLRARLASSSLLPFLPTALRGETSRSVGDLEFSHVPTRLVPTQLEFKVSSALKTVLSELSATVFAEVGR